MKYAFSKSTETACKSFNYSIVSIWICSLSDINDGFIFVEFFSMLLASMHSCKLWTRDEILHLIADPFKFEHHQHSTGIMFLSQKSINSLNLRSESKYRFVESKSWLSLKLSDKSTTSLHLSKYVFCSSFLHSKF